MTLYSEVGLRVFTQTRRCISADSGPGHSVFYWKASSVFWIHVGTLWMDTQSWPTWSHYKEGTLSNQKDVLCRTTRKRSCPATGSHAGIHKHEITAAFNVFQQALGSFSALVDVRVDFQPKTLSGLLRDKQLMIFLGGGSSKDHQRLSSRTPPMCTPLDNWNPSAIIMR